MNVSQMLLNKRDAKVRPTLEDFAPVWLIDEKVIPEDEAVQFNAVFQHPEYGWVSRRYRYDGFNNVLYYKGQTAIGEDDAVKLQNAQEPYLVATVTDIPGSYGG